MAELFTLHFYVPFEKVMEAFSVKTLKDCKRIIAEQYTPFLEEMALTGSCAMTIWDDSGNRCRRVGISYHIVTKNKGDLGRVRDMMYDVISESSIEPRD